MIPATRTPVDGRQDEISDAVAQAMPVDGDQARQEFAQEADVNYFLAKYGALPQGMQAQYGEADYTLDLHGAMLAIEDAKNAWQRLDPQLRQRFPNWMSLLEAAERGELNHPEASQTASDPSGATVPLAKADTAS